MAGPAMVAGKDGEAFRMAEVRAEARHVVDADYELKLREYEEIEATGRLKVLQINPKDPTSRVPRFIGRWDEKANLLDFDAVDAKGHVDQNVDHFSGHHSEALPDRHFKVDIRLRRKVIFQDAVSLALGRDIELGFTAGAGLECKAEVDRGGKPTDFGCSP